MYFFFFYSFFYQNNKHFQGTYNLFDLIEIFVCNNKLMASTDTIHNKMMRIKLIWQYPLFMCISILIFIIFNRSRILFLFFCFLLIWSNWWFIIVKMLWLHNIWRIDVPLTFKMKTTYFFFYFLEYTKWIWYAWL